MGDKALPVWMETPAPGESAALAALPERPIRKADPTDAGVWLDGSLRSPEAGNVALARIAVERGWPIVDDDLADLDAHDEGQLDLDGYRAERLNEIARDAEDWLTDNVAPEGHSFGWHESDFVLASEAGWCAWSGGQCYCIEPHLR